LWVQIVSKITHRITIATASRVVKNENSSSDTQNFTQTESRTVTIVNTGTLELKKQIHVI